MTLVDKIDSLGHKRVQLLGLKADIYAILANFSTLSNLGLGLVVSVFILLNDPLNPQIVTRAIVLGASFDAIDGRLARRSNTKPKLGAQFDTAADNVTFGIAPGLLIIEQLYRINLLFAMFIGFTYFFCATFRLSRFMMEPTTGYFDGMPTPVSAIFIAAWYILPSVNIPFYAASVIFISLLMISSLPYSAFKSTRSSAQIFYFIFTITLMLLLTYSPPSWMIPLAKVWIGYIIYFCIVGPLHAWHNQRIDKKIKNNQS